MEAGKARDALQGRRGSLSHSLEEIATAETQLKEQEAGRKGMVEEASAYSELALAFGKGGVQALLIEAAIPRLEDEANDLLKQMTEGRMSLKLETQRARRTGRGADGSESIETLEIVISDELGARNYEMFSGGERFRVDFAIRIALSKLLAWRAGAPLPTLFIDEGFGTQDVEGRDRILDVIKAIEDRFQRILVITHLEEIKEAFPVRIEVQRTNAGSTFSMS
jgi:exonuclease SbcC